VSDDLLGRDPADEFQAFMNGVNATIAAQDAEPARDWLFTFGSGHTLLGEPLDRRYVRIHGTFLEARTRMLALFGRAFCSQYESEAEAGVEQYHLTELVLPLQEAAR
jgi:hypothetical protein